MSTPLPSAPTAPAPAPASAPAAAARRKAPPKLHRVTVTAIEELSPRMRRITFGGEDLATYPNDGPGTHFKLLLPPADGSPFVAPEVTPDWAGWVNGPDQPIRRTFTPRRVDNAAAELVIDFALHPGAGGPASRWAEAAAVGDQTVVTGGRGAYRIDASADWTVAVGDETALPAIGTLLDDAAQHAPGARIIVIAEVHDGSDEFELPLTAGATLRWVHRGDRTAGEAGALALAEADLPAGPGRAWVGLEAAAMRTARRHLLHERGLDRGALHTRAYWKFDTAGHRDSDSGEDVD